MTKANPIFLSPSEIDALLSCIAFVEEAEGSLAPEDTVAREKLRAAKESPND